MRARFESAELRVNDIAGALDFYTAVVGLSELGREDGTVYLGCGLNESYDLAITPGGTGLVRFAIRLDEEELARELARLDELGLGYERRSGGEPGQRLAARFALPSGHEMEYVVVEEDGRLNQPRPEQSPGQGFSPLDADHVNLMATDVKTLAEFLRDVLGFRLSDVSAANPGRWTAAWARRGSYHHDVAVTITEDPSRTLHHFAWAMADIEHMKLAADLLADAGYRLELGPSRHPVGRNLFMYFLEPGGNRFELSAEGAAIDESATTTFWQGLEDTLDGWGDTHLRVPNTFLEGS